MDKNKQQTISPGLYLVSTPIGNLKDITLRALNVLKKSHIILCEDTRRSKKLLSYYEIKNKLFAYHKFNEKKVSSGAIDLIKKNKIVSLISDAGTPTISDPGMIIVNRCIEEKLDVHPIPGPSAVTSAMSVSGFNDKYLFYGFLSKKENELDKTLNNLQNLNFPIVFFVPAAKINFFLKKFKKYFFDRKILVAKEMTKIHEQLIREKIESIEPFSKNLKGELTIVLSDKIKEQKYQKKIDESVTIQIKEMLKKYSHKDVVEFISKKENLPKKMVYNFCLQIKK
ncbi:MAG: 16S rRNA (cytidine(1402)-2'-O)-methyltransferase [Pelagibacteraceae bacterium]|jgi:16S rRNA (cytidine1402-2'-O)-methyltransferase|nr:16S rRNA (cytidine(1402)-2'-O)-methyltransferase [Candidatus Pelagibacter sp.]MDP6680186.1 16S rRNA (cytidine(1402)-2'-O)-methyltransferase [Pelagibacteraceae bacterium]MDP6709917.1 16S rRNA (cytidine(1402)-2'-O)-methyltransferase [Pelagibacteraceae bacterium]|tara:strand:- start:1870 stop:2718 length:849 start_codon:yes stop_codon:yes gene_type:complete